MFFKIFVSGLILPVQHQGDAVGVFAHIGYCLFSAADTHFFGIKDQIIYGFVYCHGLPVTGVNIAAPAGDTDLAYGLGGDPVAVFFAMIKLQIISPAGKHQKEYQHEKCQQHYAYFVIVQDTGINAVPVTALIFHG